MIKIMVDSASDITKKEADKLGLIMVPIEVRFGECQYMDGIDLTPVEFYDKLKTDKNFPKTSLINEFRWREEFEKEINEDSDLIVITLSSKISGTYNSAVDAAKNYKNVYIVDSKSAAAGERLLALYAIKLRAEGLSAENIAAKLNEVKSKLNVMAMVDTLKYLRLGGRISGATAIVGEMLSIKPIVAMVDGEVKNIGKAIGIKKGTAMLKNIVTQKGGIDMNMPFGIIFSGNDHANLNKFVEDSKDMFEGESASSYILGSTIGAHVGPGAIGVAYFQN